jgi:streptogramin lyase
LNRSPHTCRSGPALQARSCGYWVSEQQVDRIARFDPKTEEWVEFPLPEAETDPRRIEIDPTNSNRIYFAGNIPGRMGFIEVLPK